MSEKMLVTQALDERDLLVKKIADKIERASFVDGAKANEEKVYGSRVDRETFEKEAKAAYQQIQDLMTRYQKIDAAIVASNATAQITTSYGTFSVAGAISLRSRLRKEYTRVLEADFEEQLYWKMKKEYEEEIQVINRKNSQIQSSADQMRLSILGNDNKGGTDRQIDVVETYVKENTMVLVDPLDISKKLEKLSEKKTTLLAELDTQIKVSNATTEIEID